MVTVTPSSALSIAAFSVGVALMLVAHMLIICWALRRGASADADQERAAAGATAAEDGGSKGLSAGDLETLPCHDFSSSGAAATAHCAVCLETFVADDRCRRLPRCEHSFHVKCVDPWLKKSRFCPVCRADVVPNGELVKVAVEGVTTPALTLQMDEERRNAAASEMVVIERFQQNSWVLHAGVLLR